MMHTPCHDDLLTKSQKGLVAVSAEVSCDSCPVPLSIYH